MSFALYHTFPQQNAVVLRDSSNTTYITKENTSLFSQRSSAFRSMIYVIVSPKEQWN